MANSKIPLPYTVRSSLVYDGKKVVHTYELLTLLGEGGMGQVYLAEEISPTGKPLRKVVLKFAIAKNLTSSVLIQRYELEGMITKQLKHPNIVRLINAGRDERTDVPFLVMAYIEGARELSKLRDAYFTNFDLKKQGDPETGKARHSIVPMSIIIQVATQLADALDVMHEQNIIHRDLKPENILFTYASDGSCKIYLLDFGIAKIVDPLVGVNGKLTIEGDILGTPANMAPEQIKPRERKGFDKPVGVGAWTDIYSAATVLFELMTGMSIYDIPESASTYAVMQLIESDDSLPRRIEENITQPDEELTSLIKACLKKNPWERPTTKEFKRRIALIAERIEPTIHYIPRIDRPHVSIAPPSTRPSYAGVNEHATTVAQSALRAPSVPNIELLFLQEPEPIEPVAPPPAPSPPVELDQPVDFTLPTKPNPLVFIGIAVLAVVTGTIGIWFYLAPTKPGPTTNPELAPQPSAMVTTATSAPAPVASIEPTVTPIASASAAVAPAAAPRLKPQPPPRSDGATATIQRDGRVFERALFQYRAGNCQRAASSMDLLTRSYPNVPKLYLVMGECALKHKKSDEAKTQLQKYLQFESTAPTDLTPEAQTLLGL